MRRLGRVARSVLQDDLGFTYTRFRRAVELAGRWDWIVAGRSLAPGAVTPPGGLRDGREASWGAPAAAAAAEPSC